MAHCTREARRPVILTAQALLGDQAAFAVTVLDLSYNGCKIETPIKLLPGADITLAVSKIGTLEARVRWCRNGQAGLSFKQEAAEARAHQQRQHERVSFRAKVSLRRGLKPGYNVIADDLSLTGCKVEFIDKPELGERLWIKFEGLGAIHGEVRWLDGFNGGIQFTQAIHPAVFELLLTKLR